MRFFSYKNRPFHLGPYPLERLKRSDAQTEFHDVPAMTAAAQGVTGDDSLASPLMLFTGMLDVIRNGPVAAKRSIIPDCPRERARHMKAAGMFFDATMAGICRLPAQALLDRPIRNPVIDELAKRAENIETKTFASGIDAIMADVRDSARAKLGSVADHSHVVVYLVEHPREPVATEAGGGWIAGTTEQRSALRVAEVAVVLANYLRILGHPARAHTMTSTDVNLGMLALAAGLVEKRNKAGEIELVNPYVGTRYSLAAVTTTCEMEVDRPLAKGGLADKWRSHGPAWWVGKGFYKSALNKTPYARRDFAKGALPFEKLKTVEQPTTFIDEPRVPRVPKRADMFARALFGDMGKAMQAAAKGGNYVLKSPIGYCARRALGAFILLQNGEKAPQIAASAVDPQKNAHDVKAALYFLGCDAVGISRCPDYAYYSHDAMGEPITPYHNNAISTIIDQGHETMEGSSGDDWIAVAQSMRAYLRSQILGGVVAEQIRRLGYSARVHSVVDGEVLQPPLLLLSGLGEVSRIGDVILNPLLGPRLKSGVVTTDMPLVHDKPIDFGLQAFCSACNKCARECPSGSIPAGPKKMFNGYEIWKSDAEKCTRYRVTNAAGAMCGRCMKTCPWNLEGLFVEAPFRWAAMNMPRAARFLAWLDDRLGNGSINPVKKWWWDVELGADGSYLPASQVNVRELNTRLVLKPEDQTLAAYTADLTPPPYPFPLPLDREKGIAAYRSLLDPAEYKARLSAGRTDELVSLPTLPEGPAPVIQVRLDKVDMMSNAVARYEFVSTDGSPLPPFEAGAHIDVVVAPEYFRQYSLAGDPADRSRYVIGVLREDEGRGGSKLMHRIFDAGRKVFVSRPINHFPLHEDARRSLLIGGGIGITPMIAMAHRLHRIGKPFELHYSIRSRASAGFVDTLESVAWREQVHLHVSAEGKRADLSAVFGLYQEGDHIYTCGSPVFMDAVFDAALAQGWPDDAMHREYFTLPEAPDWINHEFRLTLARTGKTVSVPADRSATDMLAEIGIQLDTKCSEGICGVCAVPLISGDAEHRDFVLSKKEREERVLLCCSRAALKDGELVVDL
ncbi:2Fe-2S iron-sulfur cluster binding domain-containing protein [Mesorhizobium sp. NBSH29]|uniref:2Fe-2S iron-sulfur cluster-binding protein n=1 Tax=Mesorhizobium sp. NBSH29 TaxID=2654249 RepID=UPI001896A389|nr:reductive dehalogenase domain-containing protein [Mesorhizobium sp. NBSH29]QPC85353.1 2Fe-2S iron-sulfur cluster binding domain-containing protein [Mesorhizobium sp. NBSH29]